MPNEITDLEADELLQEVGAIGLQNPAWQFRQCWQEALKDHPEFWTIEGEPDLELLGSHEKPALPIAVVKIIEQENPGLDYQSCFMKAWKEYPELRKIYPPRDNRSESHAGHL